MPKINVEKPFPFSPDGKSVVEVEAGEQHVSERCAEVAVEHLKVATLSDNQDSDPPEDPDPEKGPEAEPATDETPAPGEAPASEPAAEPEKPAGKKTRTDKR